MTSAIRSIQGEALDAAATRAPIRRMDDDAVATYMAGCSDGVAACRERARHLYPPIRARRGQSVTGPAFSGVTSDGLLESRTLCESCGLVYRVELWRVRKVKGHLRFELVATRPAYRKPLNEGDEQYLAPPGLGRMTPKQARQALMGQAFDSLGLSVAELKKLAAGHA